MGLNWKDVTLFSVFLENKKEETTESAYVYVCSIPMIQQCICAIFEYVQ